MAFKKDVVKDICGQTITIKDAYHRVETIEGNKDLLTYKISIYTDDREHLIDSKMHQFKPDISDNALRWDKQSYENAKSLDEYNGSIDC